MWNLSEPELLRMEASLRNLSEPGAIRFPAAAPNHPETLLARPLSFPSRWGKMVLSGSRGPEG